MSVVTFEPNRDRRGHDDADKGAEAMSARTLDIARPAGGFAPTAAARAIKAAGLVEQVARVDAGPFGLSARGVAALEALVDAVDLGLGASEGLRGFVLEGQASAGSFTLPALTPAQARLAGAFQLAVTCDAATRALRDVAPAPAVEGALELDGLDALLALGADPEALATRALTLGARFFGLRRADGDAAATALGAFFELLRRAVVAASASGELAPLTAALAHHRVTVAGTRWRGLEATAAVAAARGLLPVGPDAIVGNADYLAAGLRLARDVAGYDLEARKNPKRVNPVLFGLGRPGCGKTITAHAVGNYFLDHCAARDVPARFIVVRRTDWASSYQNASANNLVRLFTEEVYGFDGVAGVYWADIDTAFASRAASGLRMEEKNNLGAVFGIFDGTLLPKDGKWFLICDANTMNMDEATVSRIAQNPFTVAGPETPSDYVRLMRDIMLKDVADFVPRGDAAWGRLGALAAGLGLSGREVEAVAGNVRARVQDFDYPDAWFTARGDARAALLASLCRPVDEATIAALLERHVTFQREAEARATRERFEREVEDLVRQLNAGHEATRRAAETVVRSGVGDGEGDAS